jgi:hypothetical protein
MVGAVPAQAGELPGERNSQCKKPVLSQPLLRASDSNYYFLAPGQTPGNFEGTGWTLSGGASIKTTTVKGGTTGKVLALPSGSKAVSPLICMTKEARGLGDERCRPVSEHRPGVGLESRERALPPQVRSPTGDEEVALGPHLA